MTRSAILAYVPWHVRDLLPRAAVPVALFVVFGGIPIAATMSGAGNNAPPDPDALSQMLRLVFIGVAPLCFTLGAFLLMTRSIAEDRERHYVRFLFAHPVAPAPYYLSRFVVGLVLFLVCFVPVPLGVRAFGGDVPLGGSLMAMLTVLVLIGGLTTLCASLANKDGLVLIVVYIATQTLQRLAAQDVLYEWAQPIARGLPPVGSINDVIKTLLEGGPWPVNDLVHIIGYGLGLLVAGLLVIRRAPLVR
jgi:ABC-type transport system involved in multi-copper enzyme maturation permease subunit